MFQGGIVAYNEDIKIEHLDVPEIIIQQHGSVSPETAVAMATGAKGRPWNHESVAIESHSLHVPPSG